ncbi:MAG TPA: hypothetical protein VK530_00590 [Candidatus Acidoferrum sp.]|nr:hypothetical protein [Candidatus Acidoferrum sp.]
MNARYGKTVFDEWALVSLKHGDAKILHYSGPRPKDFQQHFASDLGPMRGELLTSKHTLGHYDFARHNVGTGFEAFVCVGSELYLFWNNTQRSMDDITRDQRWLEAQKSFAELTEHFSGEAVTV